MLRNEGSCDYDIDETPGVSLGSPQVRNRGLPMKLSVQKPGIACLRSSPPSNATNTLYENLIIVPFERKANPEEQRVKVEFENRSIYRVRP